MKQAYVERVGSLVFRELPVPEPGPGELLVRIHTALTCATDLKTLRRGHAKLKVPGPLGHEAAGLVAAVGPGVEAFSPGDAIMWVPTAPCRECSACRRGLYNHCETMFDRVAMGAYADYLLLPRPIVEQHVFRKPEHLSFAEAALLEPLACVLRGWRRLGALPAGEPLVGGTGARDDAIARRGGIDSVLILGVGAIGLLHVAVAGALGVPSITVVGGREAGLRLAQQLGAHHVVQGHVPEAVEALRRAGLAEPDVVIECTGRPEVWEQAPALVRPGGKALLFGGLAGDTRVSFSAKRIHYDEVTLLGSFHYTPPDVQEAYRLLAEGRLKLGGLITGERPLAELADAFAALERGEGVKFALRPEGWDA